MAKNKYYVVWKGLNPGVYDNWAECKAQVEGQDGAKHKSFETEEEATKAFNEGYEPVSYTHLTLPTILRV